MKAPRSLEKPAKRVRGPVALARGRRLSIYVVAAGVWATGAGWLVCHFLLNVQGQFGPQSNPLEPWWLKAHGVFAFAAIWTLGILWAAHVVNGWTSGRLRWSGASLFGLGLFLTATGYLLYYAGDENLRGLVSYAHWIVGMMSLGVFVWHRFAPRRDNPL